MKNGWSYWTQDLCATDAAHWKMWREARMRINHHYSSRRLLEARDLMEGKQKCRHLRKWVVVVVA